MPGPEPLGRLLAFTAKELREAADGALTAAGGSLGIWIVLNVLVEQGEVSQATLASHMHVEGATITHHIDRLEALGLVQRTVDGEDRRVRRLRLTEQGTALQRRLHEVMVGFEGAALAGLSTDEAVALRRSLQRIRANVEALDRPVGAG
jgi:MarR family transcriptional regulator, transcriptional regulator for hemolysin